MNQFTPDNKGVIEIVRKIKHLREEKEATLYRLNDLNKSSSQFYHDQSTFVKKHKELRSQIQEEENKLLDILGNGDFKFQKEMESNVQPIRAEISIHNGVVLFDLYSWIED